MTTTRHLPVLIRQIIITLAIGYVVLAPLFAIPAGPGTAAAAPTSSVQQVRGHHQGGPHYWSITGARIGAPSEGQVSQYGGSHKHLWVEEQLYGSGVFVTPHVDATVHQSR
jgi:hypothetical protein